MQWITDERYADFRFGNEYNESCSYPKFWNETGFPLTGGGVEDLKGCYDSDFDQYGELEAFGNFPDWQRQLTKFASVQDRVREWHPPVRDVLTRHSCLQISSLDIDGFRFDKSVQATLEPLSEMTHAYRECAKTLGKHNFFLPGEITAGDDFGSLYLGRGRQPDMLPSSPQAGVQLTPASNSSYFLRDDGYQALDASAFHYTIYRSMTRFLGMDGNLVAGFDLPTDFIEAWNQMLMTNDFINALTGEYDPRHMYGVSNQDNFRWPAIKNGTQKFLLGLFIITLELPGVPMVMWGEEQAMYVFDATADNYLFGRQPMASQTAWWTHGCFLLNTTKFYNFPNEKGKYGCDDITVTYDQRNPAHPIRNIMKRMFEIREQFPVANDGWYLLTLSQLTKDIYLPGSATTPTVTGLWSVLRSYFPGIQKTGSDGNQSLWLVYQNDNTTVTYTSNCSDNASALLSPFEAGTTLKNLFYPYDEVTLKEGPGVESVQNATRFYGCLPNITLEAWEFRAYVESNSFVTPGPVVTEFVPGHDARLVSAEDNGETVPLRLSFSDEMDCNGLTDVISLNSTTQKGVVPAIDRSSVSCSKIDAKTSGQGYTGEPPSVWSWTANLTGVYHGVHRLTVTNASTGSQIHTNAVDHFLLRLGTEANPLISPLANYSTNLLPRDDNGTVYIQHQAAGADLFRYSTDWGLTFSTWTKYLGGNTSIEVPPWKGISAQRWKGTHVRVEYFSKLTTSSDYVQEGDVGWIEDVPRRFPHLWWNGPYNQYGYDAGLDSKMTFDVGDRRWKFDFLTEWPATGQMSVWNIDKDGEPDQTELYGDVDNSSVVKKLPPSYVTSNVINITALPSRPHVGWTISLNDANLRYEMIPVGSQWVQLILFTLFLCLPLAMGVTGVIVFIRSFYRVKVNLSGTNADEDITPLMPLRKFKERFHADDSSSRPSSGGVTSMLKDVVEPGSGSRRTVLIATMEYNIEDWKIKVKIGGLGVMAQLMSQNLSHLDLIWVVPCVGDIEYPQDIPTDSFEITILDVFYSIKVQYHTVANITYILLDAPVFRTQTKGEPYPPRMDDLDSAIYYSAWNQCIAEAIKRFPTIDLYHINDFHGCLAPLYLLPMRTIPVCLSLHNAEFQGLWPLRNPAEKREVCSVFNLPVDIVTRYAQFGNVFNLLHAGASYLRFHQRGFGAVGVSQKYGKRSYARYPIFWNLDKIGSLPNPDPSDVGDLDDKFASTHKFEPHVNSREERLKDKLQAQDWAGLKRDPQADLLVFVGRWSKQKGVDLIADVMPEILHSNPQVQLICVGPVIDLYGKFSAIKLDRISNLYPGRVSSKPEFTVLPPYVFSGADFALIPSRDEPFGLVAVEFGRKGALGIGARIGGLGQTPGWWYTVESDATSHLQHQLASAIKTALDSSQETREKMRVQSAKQRFPVLQWVQKLEVLHKTAIRIHSKKRSSSIMRSRRGSTDFLGTHSNRSSRLYTPGTITPMMVGSETPSEETLQQVQVRLRDLAFAPGGGEVAARGFSRKLSLGSLSGPGHTRKKLTKTLRQSQVIGEELNDEASDIDDESNATPKYYHMSPEEAEEAVKAVKNALGSRDASSTRSNSPGRGRSRGSWPAGQRASNISDSSYRSRSSSPDPRFSSAQLDYLEPTAGDLGISRNTSLSIRKVVADHGEPLFELQKGDPTFTDSLGHFTQQFERLVSNLNKKNSTTDCSIETYLKKSERRFYNQYNDAQLKKQRKSRPISNLNTAGYSIPPPYSHVSQDSEPAQEEEIAQFLSVRGYKRPIAIQRLMRRRIGNWPVYALLLGVGQIIATNSSQITLLVGTVGETATKVYIVGAVYCICSVLWWLVFCRFPAVVALSVPWFIYSLAFIVIGITPYGLSSSGIGWAHNIASGIYAAASSSGSLFFALNFGDQGALAVKDWIFRASLIQGIQQLYTVALWYWGSVVTDAEINGTATGSFGNSWKLTAVTMPIAGLCATIGVLLALGLPQYYRQSPGRILFFYTSLLRRRIILWFFFMVIVQNFFLSSAYGRNWTFLWASNHIKVWQVVIMVFVFFVLVWVVILLIFQRLSREHSWILPVFALSLGAPRWAQTWWGTSSVGQYLPWAGSLASGAIVSRCLWLWLGVLDTVQQVGLGMVLLQTLTRVHVCFVLLAGQTLGAIATICARAIAPNRIGPGPISPDVVTKLSVLANAWFWVAMLLQLIARWVPSSCPVCLQDHVC